MRFRQFVLWILLLLVVWGIWLHRLAARDLSFDEVATWYIAQRPILEMLRYLREAVYEHPPVYYALMNVWIRLTGAEEFALRSFSVSVALLALPLAGWAVRRTPAGVGRGLIPALLLAAMPGFAYYARTARMYALGVVWVVLSSGVFLRGWLNTRSWPRWQAILLLGGVHLLALFTHYYLLFPILVQPLILLLLRRWRPLGAWLALHTFLALPGLGWIAIAPGLQESARELRLLFQAPSAPTVAHLLRLLIFSQEVRPPLSTLYFFLTLAGLGLLLAAILSRSRTAVLWLLCAVVVPLVMVFQLPRVPAERYVLFLLPPLAWSLSLFPTALFRLPGSWRWFAVLVSLALAGGLSTNGLSHVVNPRPGGYGHTLMQIRLCAQPGDGVLFYGPWQWLLFRYYDPGGLPPITTLPPQAPPRLSPEEAEPVLEDLIRRYDRLWVVPAAVDDVDPPHFVEGWLNTHAHPVWRTAEFALYLPPLPAGGPSHLVGMDFGDALRLESVEWEALALPAGSHLRFTLYWRPLRPLPGNVRVSLMLRDRWGNTWDEAHVVPGEWAHPPSRWKPGSLVLDRQGLTIPAGAPPGEYAVYLFVADEQTGEILETPAGAEIALFSLNVGEPPVEQASADLRCALPEFSPTTFCSPDGAHCITLVGSGNSQKVYPAHPLLVTLHWTLSNGTSPDVSLRLEIVSWRNLLGGVPLTSETIPVLSEYPPSRWLTGRLVTQRVHLPIPVDMPAGPAQLRLSVIGPDGTSWRTSSGRSSIPLSTLVIQHRPVLRYMPWGVRHIRVAFGNAVELRGYRVEGEARPGGTLRLTYIWYARERPTAIYAVFNHLMTVDGVLVAQQDGWPREGNWPTTFWLPGDYVEDHYVLTIPPDAPSGPYRLSVGMYDATTGERLPAVQEGQRLPEDRLFLPLPNNGG